MWFVVMYWLALNRIRYRPLPRNPSLFSNHWADLRVHWSKTNAYSNNKHPSDFLSNTDTACQNGVRQFAFKTLNFMLLKWFHSRILNGVNFLLFVCVPIGEGFMWPTYRLIPTNDLSSDGGRFSPNSEKPERKHDQKKRKTFAKCITVFMANRV